jgi:spermidine/putrescine transport system substrate-binding protein
MATGPPSLSRRRLLCNLGGAALGALALDAGLASCVPQEVAPVPVPRTGPDQSRSDRTVRFANWPAYLDRAPGKPGVHPTLAEFTARTGITVDYSEPINSNEEFFGMIGLKLAMGRDTGYDLMVLSDWLAAQLVQQGWAQELSPQVTPAAARLLPVFGDWPLPDARRFSLPWQGGFTGIIYNARVTGRPVTGMRDLLTAPDLHGRVSLVSDMRDVTGLVMLDLGIDPSDFGMAESGAALRRIGQSVRAGQIAYVTNYYLPPLIEGKLAACVGWAGDALFAQDQHPEIKFTLPAAGGMLWADEMVIPAFARHRENAERLMNFYYQPRVAAQLSAYERYLCPVVGTAAAMRRLDPALAGQKYIFPTPELLDRAHRFKILSPAEAVALSAGYAAAVGL